MDEEDWSADRAAAAGHLALHMMADLYSHQVGIGAITAGDAIAAVRRSSDFAILAQPSLEQWIEGLSAAILTRLDQEESDRLA
jgi:hypothetical protein